MYFSVSIKSDLSQDDSCTFDNHYDLTLIFMGNRLLNCLTKWAFDKNNLCSNCKVSISRHFTSCGSTQNWSETGLNTANFFHKVNFIGKLNMDIMWFGTSKVLLKDS